jgi:hypothetical protein
MRELAAAALLLLALAVGALAPKIWPAETGSGALASATPALSAAFQNLPSWRGRDGGAGFVVCGSSDTWRRPSVTEENAHLAADPRYRDQRVDDASPAARTFAASVLLYDGAGNSSRAGLATLSGLWADPRIGGTGCSSAEPQVWLFGYEPVAYTADGLIGGALTVRLATGYRMVVLTAAPQSLAVVEGSKTIAAFDLVKELPARTATPKPLPTPTNKAPVPNSPLVPIFPRTDQPIELTLPSTCAIESAGRHNDDLGMTWRVQCGSATSNRAVAPAAITQGWKLSDGNPPIGVGIQNYSKNGLWMQIAYRLDGPAFADAFVIVQTLRPGMGGYDSSPHEFTLGPWCGIVDQPTRSADGSALKWLARCGNIAKAIIDSEAMNGQGGWKLASVGTDPYATRRYCKLTLETLLESGSELGAGIMAITQTEGACR